VLERLPRSPEDAAVQGHHGAEGDGGLLRVDQLDEATSCLVESVEELVLGPLGPFPPFAELRGACQAPAGSLFGGQFVTGRFGGRWWRLVDSRSRSGVSVKPNRPRSAALDWGAFARARVLVGADDEEGDRDVLAGDSDDGQCVEELVIAEHGRSRVWTSPRVDHRPGGIGESSDHEQDQG
jgi:hypothetical protein